MREPEVVAALVRRDGDLLLVRQAGPGEEPFWALPGGQVEPGESLTEALTREVLEETGIVVRDPGRLAFSVRTAGAAGAWTAWTWEVAAWEGQVGLPGPDEFVLEAAWVPLPDAVERLAAVEWLAPAASYLRGEIEPGSLVLRRA